MDASQFANLDRVTVLNPLFSAFINLFVSNRQLLAILLPPESSGFRDCARRKIGEQGRALPYPSIPDARIPSCHPVHSHERLWLQAYRKLHICPLRPSRTLSRPSYFSLSLIECNFSAASATPPLAKFRNNIRWFPAITYSNVRTAHVRSPRLPNVLFAVEFSRGVGLRNSPKRPCRL